MKKNDILTAEELEKLYKKNSFEPHSLEKIFNDTKYNFNTMKSAPFFGEETLGIYLKIYEKLGEMGYSLALYELGLLFYKGEWWLTPNPEKSFDFHKKAAELGNADAMFELYVYYSTGQCVKQDHKIALEWCIKAAEKNHYRACYNMGSFYATGNGVPIDNKQSLEWYQKASKAGNGKASATLGVMYKLGEGAPLDSSKAEEYFKLSEEQLFQLEDFLTSLGIERGSEKSNKNKKAGANLAEPTLRDYEGLIEKLCKTENAEEIKEAYDSFCEKMESISAIKLIQSNEDVALVQEWIAKVYDRIGELVGTEAGNALTIMAEEIFKG